MTTKVGVWIDHRKALVVGVAAGGDTASVVISRIDKQLGRHGGVRSTGPFESQLVPADDRRERRLTGLYDIYYAAVIAAARDAESILIVGPGEAKQELRKRLKKLRLDGRVVGIETADKMTDRQFEAKVRGYFEVSGRRKPATARRGAR